MLLSWKVLTLNCTYIVVILQKDVHQMSIITVSNGVKQGENWSPDVFNIYIDKFLFY